MLLTIEPVPRDWQFHGWSGTFLGSLLGSWRIRGSGLGRTKVVRSLKNGWFLLLAQDARVGEESNL